MRAKIIFKSGATAEFDVDDLTTTRHAVTKEFTGMKWTTPDDWTAKLHTIEMDQIAAILVIRENGPAAQ